MKVSVKLILAAVGLFMIPQFGMTQDETVPVKQKPEKKEELQKLTPEERAQKKTDRLTEELGLSEDQSTKVYDIMVDHCKTMDELHAEMKALKMRMKAEREKTDEAIEAVLTPEQLETFRAKKEEMKKKHKEHKREHKSEHKGEQH